MEIGATVCVGVETGSGVGIDKGVAVVNERAFDTEGAFVVPPLEPDALDSRWERERLAFEESLGAEDKEDSEEEDEDV